MEMPIKIQIIFIMLLGICTPAFAYAGMADDFINGMKMIFSVFVIQFLCYIYLRFFNTRETRWFKRRVVRTALYLHKRLWTRWLSALVLSWFMIYPYLLVIGVLFFGIALLPFTILLIYYIYVVFNNEKRRKYLTGKRALARLLSASVQLTVGYVVVTVLDFLKFMVRFL